MLRTDVFCMGKKVANMAGWQIWPWDTLIIFILNKFCLNKFSFIKVMYIFFI